MITFFLNMNPPRSTAQQKGAMIRGGRIIHYTKPKIKRIKQELILRLKPYRPKNPFTGPVMLINRWFYESKKHKANTWKDTRPDTDNMVKLLKDAMTEAGFWKDDAQVASELTEKFWAEAPGIEITVSKLN
jgi:Holliday junction resolvase RusA-like endonuclease